MKRVFLTQPYLLTLHPDTEMDICWLQSIPEPGLVEFGHSHVLTCRIKAEAFEIVGLRAPATEHGYSEIKEENPPMRLWQCIAHISGLNSAERIYYRCISGGTATRIFDFHTAVKPGTPFRFAQLSDLQGFQPCNDVVRQIGAMNPDFLLYSGDAAYYAWRADQWIDLDEPWQDAGARKRAFFPAMQRCKTDAVLPDISLPRQSRGGRFLCRHGQTVQPGRRQLVMVDLYADLPPAVPGG